MRNPASEQHCNSPGFQIRYHSSRFSVSLRKRIRPYERATAKEANFVAFLCCISCLICTNKRKPYVGFSPIMLQLLTKSMFFLRRSPGYFCKGQVGACPYRQLFSLLLEHQCFARLCRGQFPHVSINFPADKSGRNQANLTDSHGVPRIGCGPVHAQHDPWQYQRFRSRAVYSSLELPAADNNRYASTG